MTSAVKPPTREEMLAGFQQLLYEHATGENGATKCREISLAHMVQLTGGTTVPDFIRHYDPPKKGDIKAWAELTALDALDRAEKHVASFEGKGAQRINLIAYAGEGRDVARGQQAYLLYPPEIRVVGGETEPATMAGMLALVMRMYNEDRRVMLETIQRCDAREERLFTTLLEDNRQAREQLSALVKVHRDTLIAEQQLLDRKAERDFNLEQKREEARQGNFLMKQVYRVLPHAMHKATNGAIPIAAEDATPPAPGTKPAASGVDVSSLLGMLEPEQVSTIMDALHPEQRELLINSMSDAEADNLADKVEAARTANGAAS